MGETSVGCNLLIENMKRIILLWILMGVAQLCCAQEYSAELVLRARGGDPESMYNLGCAYERGEGVNASPVEAASWYQRAAQKGEKRAMERLAVCYREGRGVEQNLSKAHILETAAALTASGDLGRALELVAQAFPPVTAEVSYASFAREYIARALAGWTAEHPMAKEQERYAEIERLKAESERAYIESLEGKIALNLTLKDYDPQRECFWVLDPQFGVFFAQVAIDDAQNFRRGWAQHETFDPVFEVEEGRLALRSLKIRMPDGAVYDLLSETIEH